MRDGRSPAEHEAARCCARADRRIEFYRCTIRSKYVDGAIRRTRQIGLTPIGFTMVVNEGDHRQNGRSSSAWAKYADALRRISLT